MAKSKRDKEKEARQRKWQEQKKMDKSLRDIRRNADSIKAALRKAGCDLPFYDFLDTNESAYLAVCRQAMVDHPSLFKIIELDDPKSKDKDLTVYGVPSTWTHIKFTIEDDLAADYTSPDEKANIRGSASAYWDEGKLRTIIEVVKEPNMSVDHKEVQYALKIPAMLHEVGHVMDFENQINFNLQEKTGDVIEAEVYAHLHALTECYRRAYYVSAACWWDSLAAYKDATDYRGEVVRRVFARFKKPDIKTWQEYDIKP